MCEAKKLITSKIYSRLFIYIFIYCFTAQVLQVCRSPGPTACSKTKILHLDKICGANQGLFCCARVIRHAYEYSGHVLGKRSFKHTLISAVQ